MSRMNEELISSIEDLGLSQKEARVYVASLMLGAATVQRIAEQASIKRVTAYVILESLANLGLVSQTVKGKKTFFTAEDPTSLKRLLDKKEQQLAEQKKGFEVVLPEISKLKALPKDVPSVKFYDSTEGIKSIINTFFTSNNQGEGTTIYGISNLDQVYAFFPEIKKTAGNPSRTRAGLASKILYSSQEGPILKKTDREMNRESRFVPSDKYPLNGDMTIIGNNIVLLSLAGSKPIGVTIQSRELAKGMLSTFNLAWEAAAKYPENES